MGIFSFFRKLKKEVEKQQVEPEKVRFDELGSWISNNRKEMGKNKEEFSVVLNERIEQVVKELGEKIENLKGVNIEEKKEQDKVKSIVKGNLEKYAIQVEDFRVRLAEISEGEPEEFVKKIDSLFESFHKRSDMNFKKAAFLIGKDLMPVKDTIGNFAKDVKKMSEEDNLVKRCKILNSVEEKLKELKDMEKYEEGVRERIKKEGEGIESVNNKIKDIGKNIERIKVSEDYLQKIKLREENKKKIENLNGELDNLRGMLDFKKLGEIFHVSEVAMPIIKSHKEDFREEFLKDDGEKIVGLLKDVRLDSEDVKKSYDKILGLRKEVDDFVEGEDEIGKLNKEIEKLGLEILDFESKKLGEERRVEKFKLEKESVMEFVRGETKEIGVEII